MTKTTSNRQLRETIGSVLRFNGIDSLKVEADVCSAVTRFLDEVRDGRDPVKVRADIEKAFWNGIEDSQPFEKMKQRIMDALHINLSENKSWGGVIAHCLKKDSEGQTIERFAAACEANPFGMPKPFQIAQKPELIRDTWPLAFPKDIAPERQSNELYA